MGAIWSERRKIDAWLAVEKAVCEAWHRRGRIPDRAMAAIRARDCDLERMREIEREVDHDLIAFLRATGEIDRPRCPVHAHRLDQLGRGRYGAGAASDSRGASCSTAACDG